MEHMNQSRRVLVALCVITSAIAAICVTSTTPSSEAKANTDVIYKGGSLSLVPLGSTTINWSWWGLERGNTFQFWFTTNNDSLPVNCHAENEQSWVILSVFDYFYIRMWNKTQFPLTEEVWFFEFSNPHNKTVNVTVGMQYDIDPVDMNAIYATWIAIGIIAGVAIGVLIGVIRYRREQRTDKT